MTDNSALDWNVLTKAYPLLIFHQDQLALAPRFSISHRSTRRCLLGSVVPLQPHKWLYCAETGKNFQCACMLLEFILQQLQVPSQLPWHMAPVVPRVRFLWKIPLTLKENSRWCCWRNACFPARNEKAFKSSVDFPPSENWAVTAGQNSSPGARLTSPVTVGDKVCVTCGSSVPRGGGRKEALSLARLFSPLRLEMLWHQLHNTWGGKLEPCGSAFPPPNSCWIQWRASNGVYLGAGACAVGSWLTYAVVCVASWSCLCSSSHCQSHVQLQFSAWLL